MKSSYRLFLGAVFLTLVLGQSSLGKDPTVVIGELFISDIKGWSGAPIVLSLLEVLLIIIVIGWSLRGQRFKKPWAAYPGTLSLPLRVFGACVVFALLVGLAHGANSTIALWEVRGFLMLFFAYFLSGIFLRNEKHLNDLVWVTLIGATTLAVVNTLRWMLYLRHVNADDLVYDHVDSVILVFALVLCIALQTFGGTRRQQRYALAIMPLLVFAMEVMKRRAAFAVLFIGIIAFVLFALRLRPRLFWKSVLPLSIIGALYLALFWHNTGTLGQPARAVSSIISPDARDAASNTYRTLEKLDIIINIKSSPLIGLGFGSAYNMAVPLPDLSFWRFWHFTTHNSVLWVWMKGGIVTFIAFWWLLGRGLFDGAKAVEVRREEWSFVAQLRKTLRRRGGKWDNAALAPSTRKNHLSSRERRELMRAAVRDRATRGTHSTKRRLGFNVPTWERSDDKRSDTAKRTGALALLVAAICLIPMQVMYSYVDLGLTSERDMLLFGLALGILARANVILGVQQAPDHGRRGRRSHRTRRASADAAEEETLAIVQELARRRRRPVTVRIVEAAEGTRPASMATSSATATPRGSHSAHSAHNATSRRTHGTASATTGSARPSAQTMARPDEATTNEAATSGEEEP